MLDAAIQSVLAACGAPGDGTIRSLYVPTGIDRVTLVPSLCGYKMPEEVPFECYITSPNVKPIVGDVELFNLHGHKLIGMEGLRFSPFAEATETDDRRLFSQNVWGIDRPDGELALGDRRATVAEHEKALDCERVAYYYLRSLDAAIDSDERKEIKIEPHHDSLLSFCAHVQEVVLAGKHPYARIEWATDSPELIHDISSRQV
jgi:hypothetical protein